VEDAEDEVDGEEAEEGGAEAGGGVGAGDAASMRAALSSRSDSTVVSRDLSFEVSSSLDKHEKNSTTKQLFRVDFKRKRKFLWFI